MYNNIIGNGNKFCIKNSFHLANFAKKLNNKNNIKVFDFNDLFNNININDTHKVINISFKENKSYLNPNNKINEHYSASLTRTIFHRNYILFNYKTYQRSTDLPQDGKTSSMLADLYLFYYERATSLKNSIFYKNIDDIVVFYLNDNK